MPPTTRAAVQKRSREADARRWLNSSAGRSDAAAIATAAKARPITQVDSDDDDDAAIDALLDGAA